MGSKIYLSSPSTPATSLSQDLYLNNNNEGSVSYQLPINVNIRDTFGNFITPLSVNKTGNVLDATMSIPNPNGVALQFPNPSHGASSNVGDVGWRSQNGWFDYVPPSYPEKYARLNSSLGANQWYQLLTNLTVNGVSNNNRFVDLSGIQGWAALNNLNLAVLDKLTGLMWTRSNLGVSQYATVISDALSYSVTINGNTYSDWYVPSMYELIQFFGTYQPNGAWNDPLTGLTIFPQSGLYWSSDRGSYGVPVQVSYAADGHSYGNITNLADQYARIYIHKAYNLISA